MRRKSKFAALAVLIAAFCLITAGCGSGTKYNVDYSGQKDSYSNAEDSYAAGTKVELIYDAIGTDTDYPFYLDGEQISPDYEEGKGYILRFTMPEHDIALLVETHGSMTALPDDTPTISVEEQLASAKIRTRIDNIDDPEQPLFVPLGLNAVLLTEDGDLCLETAEPLDSELGKYVMVAGGVKEVWLLPFGNGGYRTIIFLKDDDTVSAVSTTALLNDHVVEVLSNLGGYVGVETIESKQADDAMYVEAVMGNGNRYLLDPYLE